MKNIVSARRMREIENYNFNALKKSSREIMFKAGEQAAQYIFSKYSPASALCVCGSGNNGGDGFVCAGELSKIGCETRVFFIGDVNELKEDARFFYEQIKHLITQVPSFCDVVVDAIFGIGLNRNIGGAQLEGVRLIEELKGRGAKVISIDIPSGVHADSGRIMKRAVEADDTVTFLAPKLGHILAEGALNSGRLEIVSAGLEFPEGVEERDQLIELSDLKDYLPRRSPAGHKGNFGSVGVVGGLRGMEGAALLSAYAALKSGAGRTVIFAHEQAHFYERRPPELMCSYYERLEECLKSMEEMDAIVFGPGAGRNDYDRLETVLSADTPAVLDADALYILSEIGEGALIYRNAPVIITPHLGEGARLLGCSVAELRGSQADCADELASRYKCVVVLKGASTVISDGENRYMYSGLNHGMATAGSGDVLSGIIAAFLAQGDALEAAVAGVLAHGAAGREAAQKASKRAMTAGEIIYGLETAFLKAEGE